jgi:hypothetical protein
LKRLATAFPSSRRIGNFSLREAISSRLFSCVCGERVTKLAPALPISS